MAAALPITKLAGLLVKTLAKPMAKRIKHEFSRFSATQRLLIGIGQTTHALTSRLTIWSAGYKVRSITPLEPEKAMSKGADFIGESVVFLVAGSVVVWEYNLSKEKEKKKEQKRLREMDEDRDRLQAKLNALDTRLAALEKVMKANNRPMVIFGGERYVQPEHVVPIDDSQDKDARTAQEAAEETLVSKDHAVVDIRQLVGDMEKGISDPAEEWAEKEGEKDNNSKAPAPPQGWGWWGWWPF